MFKAMPRYLFISLFTNFKLLVVSGASINNNFNSFANFLEYTSNKLARWPANLWV